MVQTLVLAAGNSLPIFLEAGFTVPKVLKEVDGKTVIARALESYVYSPESLTVVLSKSENANYRVATEIHSAYPQARIIEVPDDARGALVSALFGIGELNPEEPLLIVSGDSEVMGGISQFISLWVDSGVAGGTVTFPATDPRYSFVKKDLQGNVAQVVEKVAVSNNATTGVFYFSSVETFKHAATWCLVNNASLNGLFYNSTAVNYLIEQGSQIAIAEIPKEQYKVWSRPSDFEGKGSN